ncbi:MAG: MFS transporter [Nanoarchaeota archaeon]
MKLNQTQKIFMRTGGVWGVYDGFTASFLALFALLLGASNVQIGILAAIPYIATILAEIPGAKLVEYFTRKSISIAAVSTRAFWFPLLLAPLVPSQYAVVFVLVLIFLIKFFDVLSDPAWTSWIADIIPAKIRGAYFGKRMFVIGFFAAASTLLGGFFLNLFPKDSMLGFSILFFVGTVFGLVNVFLLKKAEEPDYIDHDHHRFKEFFTLTGDFKKYTIFTVFFNFSYAIASSFFTVYMIKDLGLSYGFLGAASALATVTKIVTNRYVGLITDKIGDKPVMAFSVLGTALVPLMFLFASKEALWIIIPAQIISGIFWAGVDLASFNLMLDFSEPKKRAVQIAEFSMLTSIPLIIAPILGGYVIDNYSIFIWTGIPALFVITMVLRALSPLLLIGVKEPRIPHSYTFLQLFRETLSVLPLSGLSHRMKVALKREH